jgi:hypothetical protein
MKGKVGHNLEAKSLYFRIWPFSGCVLLDVLHARILRSLTDGDVAYPVANVPSYSGGSAQGSPVDPDRSMHEIVKAGNETH